MKDKASHIIAGILAASAIGMPSYMETSILFAGLWPAIVGGLLCGCVKEWCDMHTDGNSWSWSDLAFDAIGVAIAALFIVALHFAKG